MRQQWTQCLRCLRKPSQPCSRLPAQGHRAREAQPRWTLWRAYDYKDVIARDKASPDIFRLKDEILSESGNLLAPVVIAQAIVEELEAASQLLREMLGDLGPAASESSESWMA